MASHTLATFLREGEALEAELQKLATTDYDYRLFTALLSQAACQQNEELRTLQDDGSRSRTITSYQKLLPLEDPAYRAAAFSFTLNELAELSFFKLRGLPITEAVAFSQEYVVYYRSKWKGYHEYHPALSALKARVGVQTDMRQLSSYYPYYHLWETFLQYQALAEKPVASNDLFEALFFTHRQTWVEVRALDFILEKALRLWGAEETVIFVVRRHREGKLLPAWLLSRYLEDLADFKYAPISWWLLVKGWAEAEKHSGM